MTRRRRQTVALGVITLAFAAIVALQLMAPDVAEITVGNVPLGVIIHVAFVVGVFVVMAVQARSGAREQAAAAAEEGAP